MVTVQPCGMCKLLPACQRIAVSSYSMVGYWSWSQSTNTASHPTILTSSKTALWEHQISLILTSFISLHYFLLMLFSCPTIVTVLCWSGNTHTYIHNLPLCYILRAPRLYTDVKHIIQNKTKTINYNSQNSYRKPVTHKKNFIPEFTDKNCATYSHTTMT